MKRTAAREAAFEAVTVLDHPMLFACFRIDRNSVPDGLYLYEVRHDDDQQGLPVQIADWVLVNHWGTLITDTPIPLEPNFNGSNSYKDIDPEEDWNYEGYSQTLKEYMEESPVVSSMPESEAYRNNRKAMVVDTNMGTMPLEDYREIKAQQYGYDSYDSLYAAGMRLGEGIDKKPEAKHKNNFER